ncbi:MarR family transcriptional regulator [Pseudonocardia sp. CA-107938]|uniref:MarR family transcriptional regulator n=1 Tax=Pseudonocardia sp. CA-107938 TaxID=3240021 RepID=UPI003D906379
MQRITDDLRELNNQLARVTLAVGSRLDLRPGDLAVLDLIGREGPHSPKDLAERLHIHPATLTGVLDRLEQGGWVRREPDPADRRRIRVAAEKARSAEIARRYGPMSRSIAAICADYSPAELEIVHDFLVRIARAGADAAGAVDSS